MIRSLLLAMLAVAATASSVAAAPWNFEINMEVPVDSPLVALRGASLQVNTSWDYAALSPIASNEYRTVWPSTNTTTTLRVSGSQATDGIYPGAILFTSPFEGWTLENSEAAFMHAISLPPMSFYAGATRFNPTFRATFVEPLFNTPGVAYPRSFTSDQAIWSSPQRVTNISGFATLVPEPSSIALAMVAVASLTAFRRRK